MDGGGISGREGVLNLSRTKDIYVIGIAAGLVKVSLCVVAMLAPTFCMGGTLPVISRALGLERRTLGRGVA